MVNAGLGIRLGLYIKFINDMIYVKLSGGLGNQLFQYAAGRWVQSVTQQELCLDYSDFENYALNHNATYDNTLGMLNIKTDGVLFDKREFENAVGDLSSKYRIISKLLKISNLLFQFEGRIFLERKYQFSLNRKGLIFARDAFIPIYPEAIKTVNVIMSGFFQSTKYFPQFRNILRKELSLKHNISELNQKWINEIEASNSVCLHIRRGDYVLKNRMHCTIDYYRRAIDYIKKSEEKASFFVFSDDIEWAKDTFKIDGFRFVDANNDSCNELNLMKRCRHFIMSNSTFSWWAQYLSEREDGFVIAPRPWFRRIPTDIYLDNWITLPVYE